MCRLRAFPPRFRPIGWERALQQSRCRLLDLSDCLPSYVRADQGLIVDFRHGLLFDDLEQGRELRIDSAEDGVLAHDDFVGRERNKRASRHGVVRHEDGDLGFVVANGCAIWSAARTNPPGV
jgi:hypothetical protein